MFTPINCFLLILQNIFCKIELFEECRYLFSNCCLAFCVIEQFSTAQQVLIVETFYENEECATQTAKTSKSFLAKMKLRARLLYAD